MSQTIVAEHLIEAYQSDLKIGKNGWRTAREISEATDIGKSSLSGYIRRLKRHSSRVGIILDSGIYKLEVKNPRENRLRPTHNRWQEMEDNACTSYSVYRVIPK